MKKNKGFTLIELLAVIVILAIITLITIPIVLNTINNSEKESEKRSVEGYARAIEDDVANYLMMNPGKSYNDYVTAFNEGSITLDYKGNKVECDPISITDQGKLILTGCIVYKEGDQLTDEQKAKKNHYNYDGKNVELVQNNNTSTPSTYVEYKIGDEITVAGDQYYVIADSGINQDYVTALKAEPLTVEEVNANKIGSDGINHVNRYTTQSVGEAKNINGYGGIAYYSSQMCGEKNYTATYDGCSTEGASNYKNSDVKYVVDKWASSTFSNRDLKTIDGYNVRLIKFEELVENLGYDSSVRDISDYMIKGQNTPDWVGNDQYNYWTMTSDESSLVWFVFYKDAFVNPTGIIRNDISLRPVINVYKRVIGN